MPRKPVSEMTEQELREELLTYRLADGSKFDRDGTPIHAGNTCAFYAADTDRAILRVRVVDLRPDLKSMVEASIVEILDDFDLWRSEDRLHPRTSQLVVES
jgi:hypothetical protein